MLRTQHYQLRVTADARTQRGKRAADLAGTSRFMAVEPEIRFAIELKLKVVRQCSL
jgi:hypothetical protein